MTPRERFEAVTRFKKPDRPFITLEGAWPETLSRWKKEGWDGTPIDKIFPRDPILPVPVSAGPWPPFEKTILEEDEKTVLYIDHEGITKREFKGDRGWSSMPQFVKFPVSSEEDFDRLAQGRLAPNLDQRFPRDWDKMVRSWQKRDSPLMYFPDRWGGFFGPLRNLVGLRTLCRWFYERPELVEKMLDQRVDVLLAILEKILGDIDLDAFAFWEDMAYKTGPLISPELFKEFMVPRYRAVCRYLRSQGVALIGVDSDGDVSKLIPLWLDAGLNAVWPLEVNAQMDVVWLRKRFGKSLVMFGGIDKRALAKGKGEIEREVDRVWPVVETGGYVPHIDHSVPPDVSWQNFCHYQRYRALKAGLNLEG